MELYNATDMIGIPSNLLRNTMRFENFLRTIDMGQCEDQLQREALLDLAMLFVVIDGDIAADEKTFLESWVKDLPWNSDTCIEEYQKIAMQKALDVVQQGNVEHFIAQQARLLVDNDIKAQAVKMADEIANVDGVLDDKEQRALDMLRSYLV